MKVTVPVRSLALVFAVTDKVTSVDVDPDAGVTVNHVALDDAAQLVLEVTETEALAAPTPGAHVDGDKTNAFCVTVTVLVTPALVKVIVPVRAAKLVFTAADKVAVADVDPDVGLTVNHVALDDAVQLVLEVTETDVLAAFAPADHEDDDKTNAC